jgi:hypothetical protein
MTETLETPRLRAFENGAPPAELAADLTLLAGFSDTGRRDLWSMLGPCLTDPIPRRMEQALDSFASKHGIDGAVLARVLRACRALVRAAALLDLDGAALLDDARRLTGPNEAIEKFLIAGYEAAKMQIREVAVREALGHHGCTLEGFDWRLDQVVASSHGGRLRFPVVILTLRYRQRGREESITLQATPDRLRELQAVFESLLGPARSKRADPNEDAGPARSKRADPNEDAGPARSKRADPNEDAGPARSKRADPNEGPTAKTPDPGRRT